MKKFFYFFITVLALMLVFAFASSAEDNTKSTAQTITVDSPVEVSWDCDGWDNYLYWLSFTPAKSTYYEIICSGNQSLDHIYLYDSIGNELVDTDWNDFFEQSIIVYELEKGNTYYIQLKDYAYLTGMVDISFKVSEHTHTTSKTALEKADFSYGGYYYNSCSKCDYYDKVTLPAASKVSLSQTSYVYDGKAKTPKILVQNSEKTNLVKNTDYTISGTTSAKDIGKYTITIKGKGNYEGSKKLTYTILPTAPTGLKVSSYTYNSITLTWTKVPNATSYIVYDSYDDKIKTVTANSVKITSLNDATNYKFTVAAVRTVNDVNYISAETDKIDAITAPNIPTWEDLSSAKKGIASISIHQNSFSSGMEIYMATSKSGTYTKKVDKMGSTYWPTVSVSKLTSGKTYYFKVRSYYTYNGVTTYSKFSSVKSIKVK